MKNSEPNKNNISIDKIFATIAFHINEKHEHAKQGIVTNSLDTTNDKSEITKNKKKELEEILVKIEQIKQNITHLTKNEINIIFSLVGTNKDYTIDEMFQISCLGENTSNIDEVD